MKFPVQAKFYIAISIILLDLVTGYTKSYAMLKIGMELHLLNSLAQPFVLESCLEGECTMKLSSMRNKEMLDFYLRLDILLSLLLQQLMLYAQWRYCDSQLVIMLISEIFSVTNSVRVLSFLFSLIFLAYDFHKMPFNEFNCLYVTVVLAYVSK